MPTVNQWVAKFLEERPIGLVLEASQVTALAISAAAYYSGYGTLRSLVPDVYPDIPSVSPSRSYEDAGLLPIPPVVVESIVGSTQIDGSEWAIIRPLFELYVEREQAIHLEATRQMGSEVFGRLVSEVQQDINQRHEEVKQAAAYQPVLSV